MTRAIRKLYADLPEGQVHVRMVEGCESALVCLHQTASSSAFFEPLFLALDLPNRLVAIDLLGFSGSFDPAEAVTITWYADRLLATCDGLGIGRMHVLGHHTGASLAMELAASHPARIASIVLVGSVFMTEPERAAFLQSHGEPIAIVRDGSHLKTNWEYAAGHNDDCPLDLLHQEVVAMLRARIGRGQAYAAVAAHDATALVPRIAAPVLLMTSPDDYFHATLGRAQAAFPDAPVAVVGGANFQPALDAAGTARAVESFLAAGDPA